MTLGELVDHANGNLGLKVSVSKHDKNQLSSHGTVPVQSCYLGFDWEHGQLVLEPSVKLTTHQDVVNESLRRKCLELQESKTKCFLLMSRLSRLVNDLPDDETKSKLRVLIGESLLC